MASYRLRQSSSRSVPDNPSNKEGEERGTSTRRRRRSRTGRRAKNKLMALVFGFALFGTAGGLLALLAGELGDGIGSEPPAANGKTASVRTGQGGTVPVVTCPGTDKSTQHPAYAAACGDRAALKQQLARPGAGDAPDPRPEFAGRTALHHAAQRGDTDMLADLLAAGANPNQADAAAYTPLHLVATTPQLRHPEFVASRLLDGGARIDLRNARGLTPIEELETHQQRLLEQQNLAKVLFRKQREDQLVQSLTPAIIGDDPSTDTVVEVHTEQGRVRLAVEPAAPAPVIKKP
jgi:ankyrin repeat protein